MLAREYSTRAIPKKRAASVYVQDGLCPKYLMDSEM
jgi:hypothetical protein